MMTFVEKFQFPLVKIQTRLYFKANVHSRLLYGNVKNLCGWTHVCATGEGADHVLSI